MHQRPTIAIAFTLFSLQAQAQFSESFALANGDRVVFYGDSITDNGLYTQFVELFCICRYPKLDISFENAGVGGDRVTGGWMGPIETRLQRDLFARNPSVVTIMLGMNDASYRPYETSVFQTYRDGYINIADQIRRRAPNANVYLIQPSPFDDVTRAPTFDGGYNAVLLDYGRFVKSLSSIYNFQTIDFNSPINALLERAKQRDGSLSQRLISDRVHPGAAINLAMAAELLRAWNATPLVSEVTIDWNNGPIEHRGAKVTNWSNGSFSLLEDALPFPIDAGNPEIALVLRSSDVAKSLNHQLLRVTNMQAGTYELQIDGTPVGKFQSTEYAAGIDLSKLNTPMMQQANKVALLNSNLIRARYNRWRVFEVSLEGVADASRSKAIEALQTYESEIAKTRRRAAKPVPHKVSIVKQT